MEITAQAKNVRISPRKVRPIAAMVKKMPVQMALDRLTLLSKKGGREILSILESAVANAKNNAKLDIDGVRIKNILVEEGLKMKRRDTSHGARYGGGVIIKRAAHIKVILEG